MTIAKISLHCILEGNCTADFKQVLEYYVLSKYLMLLNATKQKFQVLVEFISWQKMREKTQKRQPYQMDQARQNNEKEKIG